MPRRCAPSPSVTTLLTPWQVPLATAVPPPWGRPELGPRDGDLWEHMLACYAQLRALPRRVRRALQSRLALDYQDDRAEGHWPMPRRSDRDFKPRSGAQLALGCGDEWIPRRIGREVPQNGPNPRRGCPNVRGGFDQSHGVRTKLCLGFPYDLSALQRVV